jgi:hypothetical protein
VHHETSFLQGIGFKVILTFVTSDRLRVGGFGSGLLQTLSAAIIFGNRIILPAQPEILH